MQTQLSPVKQTLCIRIEPWKIAKLREIAADEKRSVSNIVGLIVEDRLAEIETQRKELAHAMDH